MKQQNLVLQSLKYIIWDLLGDFIKFPIWWYTKGAFRALLFCVNKLVETEKSFALRVWIKNLFKPMFGQRDWQGKIISFFMRLIQIIFRSIALAIYLLIIIFIFGLWLVIPLIIVYEIFYVAGFNIFA